MTTYVYLYSAYGTQSVIGVYTARDLKSVLNRVAQSVQEVVESAHWTPWQRYVDGPIVFYERRSKDRIQRVELHDLMEINP